MERINEATANPEVRGASYCGAGIAPGRYGAGPGAGAADACAAGPGVEARLTLDAAAHAAARAGCRAGVTGAAGTAGAGGVPGITIGFWQAGQGICWPA